MMELERYIVSDVRPDESNSLEDTFGVSWQVIPTAFGKLLGDLDPAKSNRVMKAMLQMKKVDVNDLRQAYDGMRVD
jgi:predicted 3-demethylubiquinone-9 3-methyltransferase (glyoxalase superfamily)